MKVALVILGCAACVGIGASIVGVVSPERLPVIGFLAGMVALTLLFILEDLHIDNRHRRDGRRAEAERRDWGAGP